MKITYYSEYTFISNSSIKDKEVLKEVKQSARSKKTDVVTDWVTYHIIRPKIKSKYDLIVVDNVMDFNEDTWQFCNFSDINSNKISSNTSKLVVVGSDNLKEKFEMYMR